MRKLYSSTLVVFITILIFQRGILSLHAQTQQWKAWASGLPSGTFPKMAVAPNHDIFYSLVGTGSALGTLYKANTTQTSPTFTALPPIPLPASHVNNIQCITTNQVSEPIVGIFRNDVGEPWLFRFDTHTQQWQAAVIDAPPSLGAYSIARAPNGTIWVGAKWSYVYKSTDNGHTFTRIDESAIVKSAYPCYYPSLFGYEFNGAIYGINVDGNGRVYAGTESAGMVYSDDEGVSWHPADKFACREPDRTQKDTTSPMLSLTMGGNCAGIGFTADNNVIWTGAKLWSLNWKNSLGFADMKNNTTQPIAGIPDYLILQGQQVSKIVTAANGQIFLHSGGGSTSVGIGMYTSINGIQWSEFNTGITGQNDGQSQGSLAVDGYTVYMATHDGKIWFYTAPGGGTSVDEHPAGEDIVLYQDKSQNELRVECAQLPSNSTLQVRIYTLLGEQVFNSTGAAGVFSHTIDSAALPDGVYQAVITKGSHYHAVRRVVIAR
ncbi:MAG: hypothetical protein U0264_17570 [Candidatus Kapaibacterium sp.]|mgnify:CR=1 FL=1